jgi:hypothetical protein
MRMIRMALMLLCLAALTGCSYGGIAVSPDGSTLYVARNDGLFFGIGRRVYACKITPQMNDMFCHTMSGEP